jgi:glycerol-3-phosphate cytidylyltransferase-like family protein
MIIINLNKAKTIAHDKRRAKRAEEFAPLDEVIAKQIPGIDFAEVEAERQAIRDKYAVVQEQIDAANTVDTLKEVLTEIQ